MANNKFCIECGYELPITAKFCESCGIELIAPDTNKSETEAAAQAKADAQAEEEVEEIEERPSYLKKRGKYPPKPKPQEKSEYWREEVEETEEEPEEEIEQIEEKIEERPSYLKKRGKYKPKPKETTGRTMQEAAAEISSEYKQERLDSEERTRQERLSSYETENSSKKEIPDKKKWYKHGVFIACMIVAFIGIVDVTRRCGGICSAYDPYDLGEIIIIPIMIVFIFGIYKLIRKLSGKIMAGFGLIFVLVFFGSLLAGVITYFYGLVIHGASFWLIFLALIFLPLAPIGALVQGIGWGYWLPLICFAPGLLCAYLMSFGRTRY